MRDSQLRASRSVSDICRALESAPLLKDARAEQSDAFIALFKQLCCNELFDDEARPHQHTTAAVAQKDTIKHDQSESLAIAETRTPVLSKDEEEDVSARLAVALKEYEERAPRPERLRLSTAERFTSLDIKLSRLDAKTKSAGHDRARHIFVDSSNIYCGFQGALSKLYSPGGSRAVHTNRASKAQLDVAALDRILDRSGSARVKTFVGSSPVLQDWQQAASLGYEVSILARVPVTREVERADGTCKMMTTLKEQGVDELLHLKMHESLLSYEPGVLVLASGDANAAQFSQGSFFKIALSALGRGWHVEVCSFSDGLSALWREPNVNELYVDAFRIILLEDYLLELEQT